MITVTISVLADILKMKRLTRRSLGGFSRETVAESRQNRDRIETESRQNRDRIEYGSNQQTRKENEQSTALTPAL